MNKFTYININIDKIREMTKLGLISTTTLNHYTVYSRYDYYRKLKNYVGVSVVLTSEFCKINKRTVCRIIKEMEEEI